MNLPLIEKEPLTQFAKDIQKSKLKMTIILILYGIALTIDLILLIPRIISNKIYKKKTGIK